MRSRNGNNSFTLAIFSLILFHSLALNAASEYLISYRYVIKDATLYNEQLTIAKSMKKCLGNPYDSIMLEADTNASLKKIISKNKEKFIDYIHQLGLNIQHSQKVLNSQSKSTIILTLKTTCFKVDFNDNFAKISPLK
ncbi:hypothetical protein [Sulfurimonas sp.]|uniref:hypothetical protein n=1 Tax=Sulfurimonas sp. TaxID=2022749 RepID=UPI002604F599|nr:hypothetical protein [Sulfurimonas sp.]